MSLAAATERTAAFYRDLPVLVTGGLGFIGSSLARRLVELGARVTVLDNLNPGQGGNPHNLEGLEGALDVTVADQADGRAIAAAVEGRAVIFNLCGRVAHMDSLRDPFGDMHANVTAQIALLEAVRAAGTGARVVYAGTRSQYGRALTRPVQEDHPQQPADVNGVHKAAGERLHFVYHAVHGIPVCSLRLTNIYGPRQLMAHGRQGFFNWFLRRAMDGEELHVYGDGSQLRDVLYIDDTVAAFLLAGQLPDAAGRAFNIATGEGHGVGELAEAAVAAAGRGSVRYIEYPPGEKPIEVGDFVAGISAARETLGWQPCTPLADGLRHTVAFFAARRAQYWSER